MTKIDKKKLNEILKPNKAIYVSTPLECLNSQKQISEKVTFDFEESI